MEFNFAQLGSRWSRELLDERATLQRPPNDELRFKCQKDEAQGLLFFFSASKKENQKSNQGFENAEFHARAHAETALKVRVVDT